MQGNSGCCVAQHRLRGHVCLGAVALRVPHSISSTAPGTREASDAAQTRSCTIVEVIKPTYAPSDRLEMPGFAPSCACAQTPAAAATSNSRTQWEARDMGISLHRRPRLVGDPSLHQSRRGR